MYNVYTRFDTIQTSGDGAAHYLNFTDQHYHADADYDVVNLREKGWNKVLT